MQYSKNKRLFFIFIVIFAISFSTLFLLISITQSAYSIPSQTTIMVNQMSITLGPAPNSTNIPLETAITVDTIASASLNDLIIIPDEKFDHITSYATGPITYETRYYPAQPLKPATSYNMSITIFDNPVTWTFTTTSQPFTPEINYYLAKNNVLIILLTATIITSISGFFIWLRKNN